MKIQFVEIQNFRKLKSVRIEFSADTTVFVGANNSGKTSAMVALSHFLVDQSRFSTNDFTLSNWSKLNNIGEIWENLTDQEPIPTLQDWLEILPSLDIWLNVGVNEIHYINNLIPTLSWAGGLLGVRLRFEPKNIEEFYIEFLTARKSSNDTVNAAKTNKPTAQYTLNLWPSCMTEFLTKKLNTLFTIRSYLLDPLKIKDPKQGMAIPQILLGDLDSIEGNPLKDLMKIDEINAQRGFSDSNTKDGDASGDRNNKKKLSDQLRTYFSRHIDPNEAPDPSDLDALQAIHEAQNTFDTRLKSSFNDAFEEIGNLGYPGVNDLELILSSRIHPMDGLNHDSALQYKINQSGSNEVNVISPSLPEQYNGLGYQNLISMVFRLMSFRDHWLKVGKEGKKIKEKSDDTDFIQPIHLVLVEEPEAHLHVQVQQVFIKKAFDILRNRKELENNTNLTTQLVVTTHSSHIAHECDFGWLRYFRRKPAIAVTEVPTTTVINLSEVFGNQTETEKFVTRYLQSMHCDLFFADAAILVEGPAERILVPHFIKKHFPVINRSYITILEIGGSHAHRLRSLIEHLGLITLIITDIDASKSVNQTVKKMIPKRNAGQISGNSTIRTWVPAIKDLDKLLDLDNSKKVLKIDEFSSIRVCYQTPVVNTDGDQKSEFIANTFEDSLFYQNIVEFKSLNGLGLLKKFRILAQQDLTPELLTDKVFELLKNTDNKAPFALDMLRQDASHIKIPSYIKEGLVWLQESITRKLLDTIKEDIKAIAADSNATERGEAVQEHQKKSVEVNKS